MKKSIAALLVAILALGSFSAFALDVTDSATAIKKAATAAIKSGDMSEIVDGSQHRHVEEAGPRRR